MTTEDTPAPEPQRYVIVGRDFSSDSPRLDAAIEALRNFGQSIADLRPCFADYPSENPPSSVAHHFNSSNYRDLPPDEYLSPDASSVRFSQMNEEAEAEMAEWDAIIKGKRKKPR
ncbi:hypothetical protein [Kocuria rosea]|uniref:hypothetical protein n=1 Tax=Kocuria rosea TaxID=1275 RepID=UPI0011A5F3E9|nr:hypothetical protein [Kocuria rosea]